MEDTAKKELKDYARQLRELGKEIQTSFSGPLVSDSGVGRSWGFWLGLPQGSESAGEVSAELRGLCL